MFRWLKPVVGHRAWQAFRRSHRLFCLLAGTGTPLYCAAQPFQPDTAAKNAQHRENT